MTIRHWGKTLDQILEISAAAIDERFEEIVDRAGNMVRDRGATVEEIEAVREMQRQFLEQERAAHLAELRAWLERGCESLN